MATYTNLSSLFTGIADAIRTMDRTSEPITADDFPTRIRSIPSGMPTINKTMVVRRSDGSSAPTSPRVPIYLLYACVEDGVWASKTVELIHGEEVEIPLPDIQYPSGITATNLWSDAFVLVFYRGVHSSPCGLQVMSEPTDLCQYVTFGGSTSTISALKEEGVYVVHTDAASVNDDSAVLVVGAIGR